MKSSIFMSITKFQADKCLKIVDKLCSWKICCPFLDMVDPINDGAPDYNEIIKTPMSLHEVRNRIITKKYKDVSEFQNDMNLIWTNARKYNGEESVITNMAMEASNWFNKQMKCFPVTLEEEWMRKIQKIARNFYDAITHPPPDVCAAKILDNSQNSHSNTSNPNASGSSANVEDINISGNQETEKAPQEKDEISSLFDD